MADRERVVALTDVDDTLLDNDRVTADLRAHLDATFGVPLRERYFEIFEQIREDEGFADYLGALQRYRLTNLHDPRVLEMSSWLVDYPFAERVLPGALDAVRRLERLGTTAILSDGDAVFQPRKIVRSGLWDAVAGNVLIYVHKEEQLAYVERRFPAERYVVLDDKLRILTVIKQAWAERVTTVFVRQGHYALDPDIVGAYPAADVTVDAIADVAALTDRDLGRLAR
ncbi:MAG: HAD family hydrolase [Actinomycetota bacterium]